MDDLNARWTRAQALFEQALDLPDAEQPAWLRAQCGDDEELLQDVEALLSGDRDRLALLDGDAGALLSPSLFGAALGVGAELGYEGGHVGPWRLGERLGAGGMGAVYRAERADGGYRQTVALKLIKPGMDSEAVVARFEAERQILARLQHPGIARLLGGGLTDDRRPYFAMELVDGEPITRYCDERRLDVEARLRLFVRVCEAVRYAHQSLVIHRDLKPSNILVAGAPEEEPRPVLLDFGIARLLAASDDETEWDLTRTGHRLLTPAYAAPEQLRGERPTTATDVYALGGLLYRLLCGAAPVETDGRSTAEVELSVLNEPPKRPSERVASTAARERSTTTAALSKRLRGDLDVICRTALRKDPGDRYGSAGELLSDIQRHLGGIPIEARPATRRYRAGLFVRRHRAAVFSAAAALAALVALASFYTVRLASERDVAQQARDRAQLEAAKANEAIAFLEGLFVSSDPAESRGADITARDLLTEGADRVERELAAQPEVQAQLFGTIGRVTMALGLREEANHLLSRSLALHQETGTDPLAIARAQTALAGLHVAQGTYGTADSLLERALTTQREMLDGPHEDLVRTLRARGSLHQGDGQYDAAVPPLLEALTMQQALHRGDHEETADLLTLLGRAYFDVARLEASEQQYREALAMHRRLHGDLHPDVAEGLGHLSALLRNQKRYDEAEGLIREAIALDSQLVGMEHPRMGDQLHDYGVLLAQMSRYEEAERTLKRSLAVDKMTIGEDHPYIAINLREIGMARLGLADYEGAADYARQALTLQRRVLPPDHPEIAGTLQRLGMALQRDGKFEEAERVLSDAIAIWQATLTEDNPNTVNAMQDMARVLSGLGRHDEAVALAREAIERRRRSEGEDSPRMARSLLELSAALRGVGTPAALTEARSVMATSLERYRTLYSDESLEVGHALLERADVLRALGERAAAEAAYREALRIIRPALDEDHPTIRRIEQGLAAVAP